MSNIDVIRAWKDEDYRESLSEEQRDQLPDNPAGTIDLTDIEMESLVGGFTLPSLGRFQTVARLKQQARFRIRTFTRACRCGKVKCPNPDKQYEKA